jgi:anti-anti-sigma factor
MSITPGKILFSSQGDISVIKLVGDIRVTLCSSIDQTIHKILDSGKPYKNVLIDVIEAEAIDSTSLGLLAKLSIHVKKHYGFRPTLVSTNPSITKLLNAVGFAQIFNILTSLDENCLTQKCQEFNAQNDFSEEQLKQKVIEAHRILMSINQENKETFQELVNNLEKNI